MPLDLTDVLDLEVAEAPAPKVELTVGGDFPEVPGDSRNLAARAAESFLVRAGLARRVRISLDKRIPPAAGLGGGSSDAAAVLRGLARALPGAVGAAELAELALALGADVPFFLDPAPCWVSGIGEHCERLTPPPPAWILLLANPGVALSTARVYAAFDAGGPRPPGPPLRPLLGRALGPGVDPEALGALLHNDLEEAAGSLCPGLAGLRSALREAGAEAVGLSGSGPTLFGLFRDEGAAAAGRERLAQGGAAWLWVARMPESR